MVETIFKLKRRKNQAALETEGGKTAATHTILKWDFLTVNNLCSSWNILAKWRVIFFFLKDKKIFPSVYSPFPVQLSMKTSCSVSNFQPFCDVDNIQYFSSTNTHLPLSTCKAMLHS